VAKEMDIDLEKLEDTDDDVKGGDQKNASLGSVQT
jgi:hypothetical protein